MHMYSQWLGKSASSIINTVQVSKLPKLEAISVFIGCPDEDDDYGSGGDWCSGDLGLHCYVKSFGNGLNVLCYSFKFVVRTGANVAISTCISRMGASPPDAS